MNPMVRELPVRIVEDPSRGFTTLPRRTMAAPDLVLALDVLGDDRLQLRMYGPAVPVIGTEHRVVVHRRPGEIRGVASRLRHLWKRELIDLQPLDARGRPARSRAVLPYATQLDLTGEPEHELSGVLTELADQGAHLLFRLLLASDGRGDVERFRTVLLSVLAGPPLRIRVDSDLFLPWGMLALPARGMGGGGPSALFSRFLGHRHQIEQAGGHYIAAPDGLRPPPRIPVVSLNHDTTIDPAGRTRAADVAAALAKNTAFTERTTRRELLRALEDGTLNEQLMYFWCHGSFRSDEGQTSCLVVRLTDGGEIDAYTVAARPAAGDEPEAFTPLVLLNACYAGLSGGADLAYLGRALIERGARGVIGPQIEMPQVFAAEYALAFVTRYLEGDRTAGAIAHELARHFADEYRNPLGFAYGLHGGMDERLERG
ncbi:CHAT domain-containing protein [Streptomyces sp. NPDC005963]|uniref:CHAT domain-containing protein n=1 Tax=Streptomyces sp. NPDC005963 TaxID=3156721 RepID=UPI0033E092EA